MVKPQRTRTPRVSLPSVTASAQADDPLCVRTREIAHPRADLTAILPPETPLAWLRRGEGLVAWGVALGKVRPDYKLLAACQREHTSSPGQHLHREMRRWGHWYAGTASTCPWDAPAALRASTKK